MATTGFPVRGNFQDIVNHAKRESINQGLEIYTSGTIAPTSGETQIGSVTLVPTECFVAESYAVSAGKGGAGATVKLQYYSGPSNLSIGEKTHRHFCKDSSFSYPLNEILTPASAISAAFRDGDGTTSLMGSATMSGYFVTADLNYEADKVMLWIGDSITRGSSLGGTPYTSYSTILSAVSPMDHYAFQVRNHFQDRGESVRLLIKAMGSYSSMEMGYWLKNGWLDVPQADIIFYQLGGPNDQSKGVTNTQFTTELNRLIDWRNRIFPKAKLVLVGATPLNNNTSETTVAGFRTIMQGLAGTNNIYYVSLATSFDRTILTNYTSSDGIHPNIASNILVANTINSWIDTNNITI